MVVGKCTKQSCQFALCLIVIILKRWHTTSIPELFVYFIAKAKPCYWRIYKYYDVNDWGDVTCANTLPWVQECRTITTTKILNSHIRARVIVFFIWSNYFMLCKQLPHARNIDLLRVDTVPHHHSHQSCSRKTYRQRQYCGRIWRTEFVLICQCDWIWICKVICIYFIL